MLDTYTRRALVSGGIGLFACVALMLGGNPSTPAHRLNASDRMSMSDAEMARWTQAFYATHPVRGVTPASANGVVVDTFTVHSFYFDTDGNSATQIDTSRVHVGDRILFLLGDGFHTATSGTPNDAVPGTHFDFPVDPTHLQTVVQFDTAGTFPFFCRPHGSFFNMRGVIIVTPNASGVAPSALAGAGFTAAPWPNPSAHGTNFRFALPRAGRVRIDAFDAAGRLASTLLDASLPAGEHLGTWDGRANGRPAPAGLYYLRLSAPGVHSSTRVVIGR